MADLARSPAPWTLALALTAYAGWPLHLLPGGDSGELLAEACVSGVAHPPGYPLLLTLLRFSRWVVDTSCRVAGVGVGDCVRFVHVANALNATLAASAAACITHAVFLLSSRRYPIESVTAGLLFTLSKLSWEYARGLEVFALNNLLLGVLHVLLVRQFAQPSTKNACMGALVCGLGLANQHTIVLFEGPFIAWVLLTCRFRVSGLLWLSLAFILGLGVYLQTVLSAQTPTPGSWGDASTFSGLLAHVRRKEYGTFRLSPLQGDSEGLVTRLQVYFTDFVADFHWTGAVLTALGAATLLLPSQPYVKAVHTRSRWHQRVGLAQASALGCYLLVFHSLANLPLDAPLPRAISRRFDMQPDTILAIWMGLGLVVAARGLESAFESRGKQRRVLTKILRVSACVALVIGQCKRGQPPDGVNRRGDPIRTYGEAIFRVLPRDAVLLSYTDINWNSLRYLQACEDVRPDVTLLSLQLLPFPWFPRQRVLYPSVTFPRIRTDASTVKSSRGYMHLLHDFVAANLVRHGDHLFLDLHAVNDEDIAPDGTYLGFRLTPHGLVWRLSDPSISAELLYTQWESMDEGSIVSFDAAFEPGSWEFAAVTIANDARYQGGLYALSYWMERSRSIRDLETVANYVLGLQHAAELLAQTEVQAETGAEGQWALTYPEYDLRKNAGLVAMRLQAGLELLAPMVKDLGKAGERRGELHKLMGRKEELQAAAHRRIGALLEDMRAQNDPDAQAFAAFLARQQQERNVQPHSMKKSRRKRRRGKR